MFGAQECDATDMTLNERGAWLLCKECKIGTQDGWHRHTEQLGECSKTNVVNTRLEKDEGRLDYCQRRR